MKQNSKPFITIIIPFYVDVPRFYSDLKKFSQLSYKKYEILVVTDRTDIVIHQKNVKVVLTGLKRTGPAEKRDIAIKSAKGTICAFIDDDAYPQRDWLDKVLPLFLDEKIAAVGGPGITPKEDSYFEQLTGLVYGSFFCSGFAKYRFVKAKKRYVDDYPAYNLFVRTSVLRKINGYGSHFYGGEDTLLCLKIVESGYKILYSPTVVVYHHRRPLYISYLQQIGNVGMHRGYFARVYPKTSRRFGYFVPSILTVSFLTLIVLSIFSKQIADFSFISFLCFYIVAVLSVIKKTSIMNALLVALGIILTHISYGLFFIEGYFSSHLSR